MRQPRKAAKAFLRIAAAITLTLLAPGLAVARSDIISEHEISVRENGLILTPVLVNGAGPFEFLVDTGAAQSAILAHTIADNNLKYRLGRRVIVGGIAGQFETRELIFDSVSIGTFQMRDMRLLALPDKSGIGVGSMGGILGTDFWALHIVGFNVDRGSMRLYPPKIDFLAANSDAWDVFPMRWRKQDNGLYADVWINGVKARALVDTGATITGMTRDLAKKTGLDDAEGEESVTIGVSGRGLRTRFVIAQSFSAGTKNWGEIEIAIVDRERFGNNTQVILGLDLLAQTPFAIDYGRNRVLLVKPEVYEK